MDGEEQRDADAAARGQLPTNLAPERNRDLHTRRGGGPRRIGRDPLPLPARHRRHALPKLERPRRLHREESQRRQAEQAGVAEERRPEAHPESVERAQDDEDEPGGAEDSGEAGRHHALALGVEVGHVEVRAVHAGPADADERGREREEVQPAARRGHEESPQAHGEAGAGGREARPPRVQEQAPEDAAGEAGEETGGEDKVHARGSLGAAEVRRGVSAQLRVDALVVEHQLQRRPSEDGPCGEERGHEAHGPDL
mmetsp:Transcript_105821/g.309537  ORF Transcript_105821/g.309537 Transcript_105821/m.309537 type:complete len:255 (-) Transcript_105821:79-843(-)